MSSIIDRDTGQYAISIGTSLALEGLLGVHPEQPKQIRASKFTQVWVNIETMIRNLFAAMSKEQLEKVEINSAVELLLDECHVIQETLGDVRPTSLEFVLYYEDPESRAWAFPHARLREPTTDRQLMLYRLEVTTLQTLLAKLKEQDLPIVIIKTTPEKKTENVACLTHLPHQLLWRFHFTHFMLLESHTGRLKEPPKWASKLTGISDGDHMPFNPFTLQVFGDGTIFAGESRLIKREVKELAVKAKWTTVTTIEKTRSDIDKLAGAALKELYGRLMKRHYGG